MEKDLDKKLYNDYLNGEKQAFEFLYDKYKSKITYFIYNIVKDYQKSEDLTQETFIYIMQSKMKEDTSFKYYIYLVARSKAFNYINKEKRRNEIVDEYFSNNEQIENDVIDLVISKETKKELLDSINLLDEKYKNAVYLVNIENLSYQEVADILGETLQNTKSLVHRGKKQLRKILLKKGFKDMNKMTKIIVVVIFIGVILSGTVYAGVVLIKHFFGMNSSDGVDTAINEGYLEKVNTEYIEADGIEINVDTMLMDDYNFDMNFNIMLDEKYDIKYFNAVEFKDLKIVDETGKIVFETHQKQGLTKEELGDTYMGAYSMLPTKVSDNQIKLSLTATGNPELFPRSKKLFIDFTEIEASYSITNRKIYTGKWHFEVDVPEEFYNRETIIYKAKSSTEDGINLEEIQAQLSKTGFRISIPEIKTDKVDFDLLQQRPPKNIKDMIALQNEYVVNGKGKKFETAQRSDGDGGYSVPYEENKIINYYQTFNLTTFDATDEIIVYIYTNKGNEIKIIFNR